MANPSLGRRRIREGSQADGWWDAVNGNKAEAATALTLRTFSRLSGVISKEMGSGATEAMVCTAKEGTQGPATCKGCP